MVCTERERLTSIYNAAVATNNESAVILADSFANSYAYPFAALTAARLVSGNARHAQALRFVVKTTQSYGISYKGYCVGDWGWQRAYTAIIEVYAPSDHPRVAGFGTARGTNVR